MDYMYAKRIKYTIFTEIGTFNKHLNRDIYRTEGNEKNN